MASMKTIYDFHVNHATKSQCGLPSLVVASLYVCNSNFNNPGSDHFCPRFGFVRFISWSRKIIVLGINFLDLACIGKELVVSQKIVKKHILRKRSFCIREISSHNLKKV